VGLYKSGISGNNKRGGKTINTNAFRFFHVDYSFVVGYLPLFSNLGTIKFDLNKETPSTRYLVIASIYSMP
jgi:hypothetical protein